MMVCGEMENHMARERKYIRMVKSKKAIGIKESLLKEVILT